MGGAQGFSYGQVFDVLNCCVVEITSIDSELVSSHYLERDPLSLADPLCSTLHAIISRMDDLSLILQNPINGLKEVIFVFSRKPQYDFVIPISAIWCQNVTTRKKKGQKIPLEDSRRLLLGTTEVHSLDLSTYKVFRVNSKETLF